MPKRILEVALQEVGVKFDGDSRANQVGDNVLTAQLLFSRTLVSDVLVSTRPIDLRPRSKNKDEQTISLKNRTLGERLLFKKWIEGPVVGLKLEVTDKNSGSKISKFLFELASSLAGTAGTALKVPAISIPFSGLAIDSAVSFAKGELQNQADRSSEEKIFSLGEAWIDIPTDKALSPKEINDWTEITADLIATRDFSKLVYIEEPDPISSRPQWRTRPDKKIVIKSGSSNGWVKIQYRVYEEN